MRLLAEPGCCLGQCLIVVRNLLSTSLGDRLSTVSRGVLCRSAVWPRCGDRWQWIRRTELLLHRKSLTLDCFNCSRDRPRMTAEALVKFLAVPQLGRTIAN